MTIEFTLNSVLVSTELLSASLLDVLRDEQRIESLKAGCAPQGQCGCCTVIIDGEARVSCVTPVRRLAGKAVTTIEGLPLEVQALWAEAFLGAGASQCGFCTPGIIARLEVLRSAGELVPERVNAALSAHLCRCTGWQTIVEASQSVCDGTVCADSGRDFQAASRRATIEGGSTQKVGPEWVLGSGSFSDDGCPAGARIALRADSGEWHVGETMVEVRQAAHKVQGRKTTVLAEPPLELPGGTWDRVLRTSWVEPAYLDTDSSWCLPGGDPSDPSGNGGAFGSKQEFIVATAASDLAQQYQQPIRVRLSREDVVRLGPKRPPIAAGVNDDGTGVIRVVDTPGIADAISSVAPQLKVELVHVDGPPTSARIRAAGWAEAAVLMAATRDRDSRVTEVTAPNGSQATAEVSDESIAVTVRCGEVLDEVVLRSYCIGAAHMAYGWVTNEGLAVDSTGEILNLTIRSFGVVRPGVMPPVTVTIIDDSGPAINGSDAVFAAVAGAVWRSLDYPTSWPCGALPFRGSVSE